MSIIIPELQKFEVMMLPNSSQLRIWGWWHANNQFVAFWNLSNCWTGLGLKNHHQDSWRILTLRSHKHKAGFVPVDWMEINTIWPQFGQVFDQEFTRHQLSQPAA